jgi:hypothetical protein
MSYTEGVSPRISKREAKNVRIIDAHEIRGALRDQ